MKTNLLTSLLKAILTGIVENYNPYANAALVMICFQQNIRDLSNIIRLSVQHLSHLIPQ